MLLALVSQSVCLSVRLRVRKRVLGKKISATLETLCKDVLSGQCYNLLFHWISVWGFLGWEEVGREEILKTLYSGGQREALFMGKSRAKDSKMLMRWQLSMKRVTPRTLAMPARAHSSAGMHARVSIGVHLCLQKWLQNPLRCFVVETSVIAFGGKLEFRILMFYNPFPHKLESVSRSACVRGQTGEKMGKEKLGCSWKVHGCAFSGLFPNAELKISSGISVVHICFVQAF